MVTIEKKHLEILKNIFKKYPYTFYAYGSRVTGKNRKYSDLDLCYKEEIPTTILLDIQEKLEESDLPFRVDLVFWDDMPEGFQKLIEKDLKPLNLPPKADPPQAGNLKRL